MTIRAINRTVPSSKSGILFRWRPMLKGGGLTITRAGDDENLSVVAGEIVAIEPIPHGETQQIDVREEINGGSYLIRSLTLIGKAEKPDAPVITANDALNSIILDITPGADGGSPLGNRYIWRGFNPEALTLFTTIVSDHFEDTEVEPGVEIFYSVVIENEAGFLSDPSELVSARAIPAFAPNAITDLSAEVSGNTAQLTHGVPNDNGAPILDFDFFVQPIESNPETGTWVLCPDPVSNITGAFISGLSGLVATSLGYRFYAIARNAIGPSLRSNYATAEISVGTPLLPPAMNFNAATGASALSNAQAGAIYTVHRGTRESASVLTLSAGDGWAYLHDAYPGVPFWVKAVKDDTTLFSPGLMRDAPTSLILETFEGVDADLEDAGWEFFSGAPARSLQRKGGKLVRKVKPTTAVNYRKNTGSNRFAVRIAPNPVIGTAYGGTADEYNQVILWGGGGASIRFRWLKSSFAILLTGDEEVSYPWVDVFLRVGETLYADVFPMGPDWYVQIYKVSGSGVSTPQITTVNNGLGHKIPSGHAVLTANGTYLYLSNPVNGNLATGSLPYGYLNEIEAIDCSSSTVRVIQVEQKSPEVGKLASVAIKYAYSGTIANVRCTIVSNGRLLFDLGTFATNGNNAVVQNLSIDIPQSAYNSPNAHILIQDAANPANFSEYSISSVPSYPPIPDELPWGIATGILESYSPVKSFLQSQKWRSAWSLETTGGTVRDYSIPRTENGWPTGLIPQDAWLAGARVFVMTLYGGHEIPEGAGGNYTISMSGTLPFYSLGQRSATGGATVTGSGATMNLTLAEHSRPTVVIKITCPGTNSDWATHAANIPAGGLFAEARKPDFDPTKLLNPLVRESFGAPKGFKVARFVQWNDVLRETTFMNTYPYSYNAPTGRLPFILSVCAEMGVSPWHHFQPLETLERHWQRAIGDAAVFKNHPNYAEIPMIVLEGGLEAWNPVEPYTISCAQFNILGAELGFIPGGTGIVNDIYNLVWSRGTATSTRNAVIPGGTKVLMYRNDFQPAIYRALKEVPIGMPIPDPALGRGTGNEWLEVLATPQDIWHGKRKTMAYIVGEIAHIMNTGDCSRVGHPDLSDPSVACEGKVKAFFGTGVPEAPADIVSWLTAVPPGKTEPIGKKIHYCGSAAYANLNKDLNGATTFTGDFLGYDTDPTGIGLDRFEAWLYRATCNVIESLQNQNNAVHQGLIAAGFAYEDCPLPAFYEGGQHIGTWSEWGSLAARNTAAGFVAYAFTTDRIKEWEKYHSRAVRRIGAHLYMPYVASENFNNVITTTDPKTWFVQSFGMTRRLGQQLNLSEPPARYLGLIEVIAEDTA